MTAKILEFKLPEKPRTGRRLRIAAASYSPHQGLLSRIRAILDKLQSRRVVFLLLNNLDLSSKDHIDLIRDDEFLKGFIAAHDHTTLEERLLEIEDRNNKNTTQ